MPEPELTPPRDQLRDRLKDLRTIVPPFAVELTAARRQAAKLRPENGRLLEQVRELQRRRAARRNPRGRRPAKKAAPKPFGRVRSVSAFSPSEPPAR
jgi:hypothetical protein